MRRVELLHNDTKNHCLNQLGYIPKTKNYKISIDYLNNLSIYIIVYYVYYYYRLNSYLYEFNTYRYYT